MGHQGQYLQEISFPEMILIVVFFLSLYQGRIAKIIDIETFLKKTFHDIFVVRVSPTRSNIDHSKRLVARLKLEYHN